MPAHSRLLTLVGMLLAGLLSACGPRVPEVVKIGVVAPFEGEHREIGYDVIPSVRLAVREWAAQPRGGVAFEVVAYDDGGSPENAAAAARRLATDPDVAVVIGHWRDETTAAALPTYAAAGLPVVTWATADLNSTGQVANLAPSADRLEEAAAGWVVAQGLDDVRVDLTVGLDRAAVGSLLVGGPGWGSRRALTLAGNSAEGALFVTGAALPADAAPDSNAFAAAFAEGSLGAEPGLLSWPAYRAAWVAMQLVAGPAEGAPFALPEFDASGRDPAAGVYLYRWSGGQLALEAGLR